MGACQHQLCSTAVSSVVRRRSHVWMYVCVHVLPVISLTASLCVCMCVYAVSMHDCKHGIFDPLSLEPSILHTGLFALTETSSSSNELLKCSNQTRAEYPMRVKRIFPLSCPTAAPKVIGVAISQSTRGRPTATNSTHSIVARVGNDS